MDTKKLIIFDFDGVLREVTIKNVYDAYIQLVIAMGKKPESFFTDIESFKQWYTIDWHKNEMRIMGVDTYEPHPEFDKVFHDVFDPTLVLFPWVESTLEHLSQKYTLAILSSSSRLSVEKALGDLTRYFSLITGSEQVQSLKPDPEGVLLTLALTGTKKDNAIMIGDTNVDFFAGKNAGIKTGLVKWGLGDWTELLALGADYYFEKQEDLHIWL